MAGSSDNSTKYQQQQQQQLTTKTAARMKQKENIVRNIDTTQKPFFKTRIMLIHIIQFRIFCSIAQKSMSAEPTYTKHNFTIRTSRRK